MTLIEKAKALGAKVWIVELFAREFGYSDLLSNYSRAYAWMANQLGHMTLGLATTALFVMLADTLATIARASASDWRTMALGAAVAMVLGVTTVWRLSALVANNQHGARPLWVLLAPAGGIAALALGAPDRLNDALLGVSALVVALAALALALVLIRRPRQKRNGDRWWGCDDVMRIVIGGVAATLLITSAGQRAIPAAMAVANDPRLGLALWAGPTALVFLGVILMLSKDLWRAALGSVGLLGAVYIATDGLFVNLALGHAAELFDEVRTWSPRRAGGVALAVLFVAVSAAGIWGRAPLIGREPPIWLMTTALGGGIWFMMASWCGIEAGWAAPVAGGIASMAVWWVKEFGSDLPNVAEELQNACSDRKRQKAAPAPTEIVEGYWRDGEWDCRTDGLFYFAGAWIGAGLLSDSGALTADNVPGAWRSGAEIIGLLIFIAIFLLMGRNWAKRQQAIDMTGAPRADRLALFGSRLSLAMEDGRSGWRCDVDPLKELLAFATALPTSAAPFDHLVVVGGPGSGKSTLGHALATEAALVGLPASFARLSAMLGLTDHSPVKRSRVVTAEHLASISERYDASRPYQAREVQANPVVTLYLLNDAADRGLRTATRDQLSAPHGAEMLHGAELVVITDMRRNMSPADFSKLFVGLAPSQPIPRKLSNGIFTNNFKQTVWLIENGPELKATNACEATLDHALMDFINTNLRPGLASAGARCRVAIAHVARDTLPGQAGPLSPPAYGGAANAC